MLLLYRTCCLLLLLLLLLLAALLPSPSLVCSMQCGKDHGHMGSNNLGIRLAEELDRDSVWLQHAFCMSAEWSLWTKNGIS